MIVPMHELLADAAKNKYGVGAFNTNNLEYIQAIIESAVELKSPVIISAAESEVLYMGGYTFTSMVKNTLQRLGDNIPVAIHLDHGPSFERAANCIREGFSSVMFDGSSLPLEKNISITKEVVKLAHSVGVTVEGEIGVIGGVDEIEGHAQEIKMSDVDQCTEYVANTKVDCLAAAIGNAHGFYTENPKLDFDRLQQIRENTKVPMVLHGGTGIPDEDVQKAIKLGVTKINFSTVVRHACITEIAKILTERPNELDLMSILGSAKLKMKEVIKDRMLVCGSNGRA